MDFISDLRSNMYLKSWLYKNLNFHLKIFKQSVNMIILHIYNRENQYDLFLTLILSRNKIDYMYNPFLMQSFTYSTQNFMSLFGSK